MWNRLPIVIVLLLAACTAQPAPDAPPQQRPPDSVDTFDDTGQWITYDSPAIFFGVVDGLLRGIVREGGRYAWSLKQGMQRDITLEATLDNFSSDAGAFAGLLCRASPQNDGRGYYFLISADGAFSIRRGSRGGTEALVPWQNHRAIRTDGSNRLRVICDGQELIFFANGRRLGSAQDDRYQEGYPGVVVGLPPTGVAGAYADFGFDDVRLWQLP